MITIELHSAKSVNSFDLDLTEPPRTALIEYQGELYHTEDERRLVWNVVEGPLPQGASCSRLHDDCSIEVATDQPPAVEPAPESSTDETPAPAPSPAPEGSNQDDSPDQSPAV